MKIIDIETRGNLVKFYLGNDDLEDWYGDDWDDVPYEHNADPVHDRFVVGTAVYAFDWDDIVVEPCNGYSNSVWSKDAMKAREVYAVCILKAKDYDADHYFDKTQVAGNAYAHRIYLGDTFDPTKIPGYPLSTPTEHFER
jgi:hypothetical protein